MTTRPWPCPLFGRKSRPRRPARSPARPAPGGARRPPGPRGTAQLRRHRNRFGPAGTGAAERRRPSASPSPRQASSRSISARIPLTPRPRPRHRADLRDRRLAGHSHLADIDIGQANNITTLQATLPGDTLTFGVIADASGGLGNVAASTGVITVTGLDTSHSGTGNGNVDLRAAGPLTVVRQAVLDTGTGTISLAADVNADGTGNSNSGAVYRQRRDCGFGQPRHAAPSRCAAMPSTSTPAPTRPWSAPLAILANHPHRHPHRAEYCPPRWPSTPAATSSSPTWGVSIPFTR